jgi:hypothetical protein
MARQGAQSRANNIVLLLLERHGETYCDELGIDIARNTPSALFRWLCATLLFSTRISSRTAVKAAKGLAKNGWTTAEAMRASAWEERVRILDEAGYARYDESMATKLGALAERLLSDYQGDLREMRKRANRDGVREHQLVQDFKGIGTVGADIFCREAQIAWKELYPFADRLALGCAKDLGLNPKPSTLADLVSPGDFARLVAALVRVRLADGENEIRQAANSLGKRKEQAP